MAVGIFQPPAMLLFHDRGDHAGLSTIFWMVATHHWMIDSHYPHIFIWWISCFGCIIPYRQYPHFLSPYIPIGHLRGAIVIARWPIPVVFVGLSPNFRIFPIKLQIQTKLAKFGAPPSIIMLLVHFSILYPIYSNIGFKPPTKTIG